MAVVGTTINSYYCHHPSCDFSSDDITVHPGTQTGTHLTCTGCDCNISIPTYVAGSSCVVCAPGVHEESFPLCG